MWDFSDIQDAPIKESVFDLPQETLDRYADASPSEVRAYYYKNGGQIPHVQCAPKLEDFGPAATYAAEDLCDEEKIERIARAILTVAYIGGYILCALLWNLDSFLTALLATAFTYGWIAFSFYEIFLSNKVEESVYKRKLHTPLKEKITAYKDAGLCYDYWENAAFFQNAECQSASMLHSTHKMKMNFLDAHAFVYEYVGIFARGDGNVFGFPASDLSFYGANWKDILFDAAKIWGAHVIFYDNSPDDLVDNMCKLLFSYNLGVDRKEYERMKQEADLWLSSCGRKGAFSLRSDELDAQKKYSDYLIFLDIVQTSKNEMVSYGIDADDLPYKVVRELCVNVYQEAGVVFRCEYIPFYIPFHNMRICAMIDKEGIYAPYYDYLMSNQ